jgi:uncharacterized membrane protein YkvA (DUF1232 family)
MRNKYFDLALLLASRVAGKPARLAALATRLLVRLDRNALLKLKPSAMTVKLKQLGRLIAAYARGEYRRLPVKAMITLVAAAIYFLNPLDLVPDMLPALGLTDDLAVVTWVYHSLSGEMESFLLWEERGNSLA